MRRAAVGGGREVTEAPKRHAARGSREEARWHEVPETHGVHGMVRFADAGKCSVVALRTRCIAAPCCMHAVRITDAPLLRHARALAGKARGRPLRAFLLRCRQTSGHLATLCAPSVLPCYKRRAAADSEVGPTRAGADGFTMAARASVKLQSVSVARDCCSSIHASLLFLELSKEHQSGSET